MGHYDSAEAEPLEMNEENGDEGLPLDECLPLLEAWVAAMPEEECKRPFYASGSQMFSPEDLLKEIQNGTSHGKAFLERWKRLRQVKQNGQ